ncbi:TPA: hypothetical protein SIA39_004238, partial [Aeromonas sobria]|nr:hypothetical protein [Aeromonas sobria]
MITKTIVLDIEVLNGEGFVIDGVQVDSIAVPMSTARKLEELDDVPKYADNKGKFLGVNSKGTAPEYVDLRGEIKATEQRSQAKDNALDAAIKAESKARNDAITNVSAVVAKLDTDTDVAIKAEAKARADADAKLQVDITKIDTDLDAAIKAEAKARTDADTKLQADITKAVNDSNASDAKHTAAIKAVDDKVQKQGTDVQAKIDQQAKNHTLLDTKVNTNKTEVSTELAAIKAVNAKAAAQLDSLGSVTEKGITDLTTQVHTLDKRLTDTGAKLYQDMVNVEAKLTAVDAKTAETNKQQDARLTKIEADFATEAYVQAELKKISITDIKQVKAEAELPKPETAYGDFYFITSTKEWKTSDGKAWLDVTAVVPDEVQSKLNKMQADLEAKIVQVEKNAKTAHAWLKLDG